MKRVFVSTLSLLVCVSAAFAQKPPFEQLPDLAELYGAGDAQAIRDYAKENGWERSSSSLDYHYGGDDQILLHIAPDLKGPPFTAFYLEIPESRLLILADLFPFAKFIGRQRVDEYGGEIDYWHLDGSVGMTVQVIPSGGPDDGLFVFRFVPLEVVYSAFNER